MYLYSVPNKISPIGVQKLVENCACFLTISSICGYMFDNYNQLTAVDLWVVATNHKTIRHRLGVQISLNDSFGFI